MHRKYYAKLGLVISAILFLSSSACKQNTRLIWNGSSSVSCVGTFCAAGGSYNTDFAIAPPTVILARTAFTSASQDGGKSFAQGLNPTLPSDATSQDGSALTGMYCSGMNCMGVGTYNFFFDFPNSSITGKPLVVMSHDFGQSFTEAISPPMPSGATDQSVAALIAATCFNKNCVSVGLYVPVGFQLISGALFPYTTISNDGGNTFIDASVLELPADANISPTAQLMGVSCIDKNCVAVGRYTSQTSGAKRLAYFSADSGKTFIPIASPVPDDINKTSEISVLKGVICNNKKRCMAYGGYYTETNEGLPYIAYSDDGGKTFTRTKVISLPSQPAPLLNRIATLNNISCTTTNHCVGVGIYNYDSSPMVETGAVPFTVVSEDGGETFSDPLVPSLPNDVDFSKNNILTGVNCSVRSCVGVGSYNTAVFNTNPTEGRALTFFGNKTDDSFTQNFIPQLPDDANLSRGSVFGVGNLP